MEKIDHKTLRAWIEIDTKAILSNYYAFRKFIPKNVHIAGVVKSNAYGSDAIKFALTLEHSGIEMFAVDSLDEAISLRNAGIKIPILVLGYTIPEMFPKALSKNIHITISTMDSLKRFANMPNLIRIPVHLKVDTGMHRQGFLLEEIKNVLRILVENDIKVVGLYTHFASAKEHEGRQFTDTQIAEFEKWRIALRDKGFSLLEHASATGGALGFPSAHFDMVRVGIGLCGIWSSDEIRKKFEQSIPLKPILSWKTIISEIKEIPAGSGIGYDLTHKTSRNTRIAVCPVGYWHGYMRELSNKSEVLVRGKRARVLGRVSMDMIVIDITDIARVKVGCEAVLIGRSGKEEITVKELALYANTTAHELLTRLNPIMKRIYK